MVQEQKQRKTLTEHLWGRIELDKLPKVDNEKVERLLKGGYLFGFTASDLLIILSAILTLFFLQIQPYLIPYLEGRLDLRSLKVIENKFTEEQVSERSLDAVSELDKSSSPSSESQISTPSARSKSINLSALVIVVDHDIDLLVTDPQGRQTGIDSDSGSEINDIPGASYYLETNLANDVTGLIPANPSARTFSVPDPIDGIYDVQVIGNLNQTYTIDFRGYDQEGVPDLQTLSGLITPASIESYQISYSSTPGAVFLISRLEVDG